MVRPPPVMYITDGLSWHRCCKTLYEYKVLGLGVGWQRLCKTCQSLRKLDNQGTVFFFSGLHDGHRVR